MLFETIWKQLEYFFIFIVSVGSPSPKNNDRE